MSELAKQVWYYVEEVLWPPVKLSNYGDFMEIIDDENRAHLLFGEEAIIEKSVIVQEQVSEVFTAGQSMKEQAELAAEFMSSLYKKSCLTKIIRGARALLGVIIALSIVGFSVWGIWSSLSESVGMFGALAIVYFGCAAIGHASWSLAMSLSAITRSVMKESSMGVFDPDVAVLVVAASDDEPHVTWENMAFQIIMREIIEHMRSHFKVKYSEKGLIEALVCASVCGLILFA